MKPLILITNDDGIFSPGLMAAAEAVAHLGELLIAAPRFQQTSMSRSFPRDKHIGVIEKIPLNVNGITVESYGVYGTPAHSVAHAVLELAERKPDLCISGINYGENVGLCLSCSGTIGAALEADCHNIPAIAVSYEVDVEYQHTSDYILMNWEYAKKITANFAELILNGHESYKNLHILNINLPADADDKTVIKQTKQSRCNYFEFQKPNPKRSNYHQPYQLTSKKQVDINKIDKGEDVYALYVERAVSVTPLTWDMTDSNRILELNT